MKTHNYLFVLILFFCQLAYSQSVKKNALYNTDLLKQDPSAQLKQSLQLPHVGAPSLKIPSKILKQKNIDRIAFHIAGQMEEAKAQCPYLKFKASLQLEGERKNNEEVGLKWETTNGFDNMAFEVERSLKDTTHFEKVNFVWASERIRFEDKYTLADNNDYDDVSWYRLKLLLNDGSFVYSNIAAVKGYNNLHFAIYPNPANQKIKIDLKTKESGNAIITIYDALGRKVQQQTSGLTKGYNLLEMNISKLAAGSLMVKIILPGNEPMQGVFIKN